MLTLINNSNFQKFGLVLMFFVIIFCAPASFANDPDPSDDTVTRVICNVIGFVQGLGLPIMTGVIIGSSIMAIFGRLAWPAIVMLIVFTAIFFGAGTVVGKFSKDVNESTGGDACAAYR